MLQRIKRFQKRLAENNEPSASRPSSSRFSLKRSPLIRELALRVGQGQPAAIVQTVSHAAVAEAGQANVSSSTSSADVTHPYILQILREIRPPRQNARTHAARLRLRHSVGCNIGCVWFQTPAHRRAAAQGHGQKQGCSSAVFWCCGPSLPLIAPKMFAEVGRISP